MEKFKLPVFEKWEDLTLANNFIFCKVMEENPDVAKELLELLLDIKIDRLERPQSEKQFKTDFVSRGIRFDVYVKDGTGRSFDIEIQTTRKTNLIKRARYYHGLMDVDALHSGIDYNFLKDSYVIFLCLGDVFGYGLPVYTFQKTAKEDSSILMNDGTTTVFFDALNYDKMKSEKVRSFFKFLCGLNIKDNFTEKLSALVERLKVNAQRRHEYMTWEQEMKEQAHFLAEEWAPVMAQELAKDLAKGIAKDMAEEIAEEKAKGMANDIAKDMAKDIVQESALETAKNFLTKNIKPSVIAECTGLPLEKVLQVQKEIMNSTAK